MIRPTSIVYWNSIKGGGGVISRNMTTFSTSNASAHPISTIIARLLAVQYSNAASTYRLALALQKRRVDLTESLARRSYIQLKKRVTRTLTLGDFIRGSAKEWISIKSKKRKISNESLQGNRLPKRYHQKTIQRFNTAHGIAIRLDSTKRHTAVRAQSLYCSAMRCGLNVQQNASSSSVKGRRQSNWCDVCSTPVCLDCWEYWHTTPQLSNYS